LCFITVNPLGATQMKKSLLSTLIAVPTLALSSMAFAAEPVTLTADQMDDVTAGAYYRASVFQVNASPVTLAQVNVLSYQSANNALILSGNFAFIRQ
jgi:hypothetical protein